MGPGPVIFQDVKEANIKRLQKIIYTLSAVSLVLCLGAEARAQKAPEYAENRVIVKVRRGVLTAAVESLQRELGSRVMKRFRLIDAEVWEISGLTVEEAVERYSNDPRVAYIEPDYIVYVDEVIPKDPNFALLWGLHNTGQSGGTADADIDAPEAWETTTGDEVIIGVIDTGVDYLHEDLASNIWINTSEIPGNGIDDDGNGFVDDVRGWDFCNNDNDPMDDHYHGTHCAGTIAGAGNNEIGVTGVCWSARIMPLKFLDATGRGYSSDAALAVEYATMMGARLTSNSWGGGGYSSALRDAIAASGDAGMLFIAGAGNSGMNTDYATHYPSCYDLDNIICIAATDHNDNRAGFSNYGEITVDLGAPGVNIYSTTPDNNYGYLSGTSMATPHVAGVVGLVWSAYPQIPHLLLKEYIMASVDTVQSLVGRTVTGGRLNAFGALVEPDSIPPAEVTDLATTDHRSNSIGLTWTSTGDDSTSGQAAGYDIRYSLSPIDTSNFNSAVQVDGEPAPRPSGSEESFTVTGLDFNTTYYFAMKVIDDWTNWSGISNVAFGTTLGIPTVSVNPDSLSDSLMTGDTSSHMITIENIGEGTLDFNITYERTEPGDGSPLRRLYTLTLPIVEEGDLEAEDHSGPPVPIRTAPLTAELDELTGVRIMFDRSHGQGVSGNYGTLISDLVLRGAVVTENFEEFTPDVLADFEIIWLVRMVHYIAGSELTALSDWVNAGGGLVLETDYHTTVPLFNMILDTLAAGIEYSTVPGTGGATMNIYPHPATEGVNVIRLPNNNAHLSTVTHPAYCVIEDIANVPNTAHSIIGAGRVIAIAEDLFSDGTIVWDDNQLFGNRVFDWLAAGAGWIKADPASGTVFSGDSTNVDIIFDASGLYSGDYAININIESNDPVTPEDHVFAQLHVTGAPDIAASDSILDFGTVFIEYPDSDTLVITNTGADSLFVSGVYIDNAVFSVDSSGFELWPYERRELVIICAPYEVGAEQGTLTIVSNDPDDSVLTISLQAAGVYPPEISVAPASLSDSLYTGEQAPHILTIDNSGESDLIFAIMEGAEGLAIESMYIHPSKRSYEVDVLSGIAPDAGMRGPGYVSIPAPFDDRTSARETRVANVMAGELRMLLIVSNYYYAIPSIRSDLLSYPDISVVDVFDAYNGTPTLGYLMGYDCVLVTNNYPFKDRAAFGDVLADYVDYGGGVIITLASFVVGWEIQGRFAQDGYLPFESGSRTGAEANLGEFDTDHPIMEGVTDIWGDALAYTSLPGGAEWIASWDNDFPLVATKGENIVGINAFLAINGFWTGDIPLLIHNAAFWTRGTEGICWAYADPAASTVPAHGSADVTVTFHPRALCAPEGDYTDTLVVVCNDPETPQTIVRLDLHVVGAPDIMASDSLLDYGTVLIGATASDTIEVGNYGTEVLTVTNVSVDNPAYSVDSTGFVLGVNETGEIIVEFAPDVPEPIEGVLSISSDDPDEPVLTVALHGNGLEPPEIVMYPGSLSDSLFRDETSTQVLTIGNTGVSDLVWDIRPLSEAPLQIYTLAPPPVIAGSFEEGDDISTPHEINATPLTAALADLSGINILYDESHGQGYISFHLKTLFGDLTTRGAVITINKTRLTPELLDDYDVFWTYDFDGIWDESETTALVDWVLDGGGLLLEGDETVDIFNSILEQLGAGIEYSPVSGTEGITTNIFPHETTRNVQSIHQFLPKAHLSSVAHPAACLIEDIAGTPSTAYSVAGLGRIIAIADELFLDNYITAENNRLFGNQAIDWLACGVNWISADPLSGVVPPGDSTEIDITFNAAGPFGGDYDATLHVENNDPSNPEVIIPVHLEVTGVPGIAVSDTLLDFRAVLIGAHGSRPLVVSSVGTGVLVVSGASITPGDYSADTTGFSLLFRETREIDVTFVPGEEGTIQGTMTFISNDPTDSVLTVSLTGVGLIPPEIVVSPDSLCDSLIMGDMSQHTLTIENTGEYDLIFNVAGNGPGKQILMVVSGIDVSHLQAALLDYPNITAVDVFDGSSATPTLEYMVGYQCVIVATSTALSDPIGVGDVLADYVDLGGGVLLALASFLTGLEVQGRFLYDGYSPFVIGSGMESGGVLGSYDHDHPIMAGIAWVPGDLYGNTTLADGADWVADWSNGPPCIATMGERVAGLNFYIGLPDPWTGLVAMILRNAVLWSSGGEICWAEADPKSGVVAPHTDTEITVTFSAANAACVSEGDYRDTLTVKSNVPSTPQVHVPLCLHVMSGPDIEVVSPNGGEQWYIGDIDTIVWTVDGPEPDSIGIFLSRDGGVSYGDTIVTGLSGVSVYGWTTGGPPTGGARFKIVAHLFGGIADQDESDGDFSIIKSGYRYVSPTGGNIYPYGLPEHAAHGIQDAVDASSRGDTILVADSTYTSAVTVSDMVYLKGGWNRSFTAWDPEIYVTMIQSSGSPVSFMNISGDSCGIEGFTITGGTGQEASLPVSGTYGGGIFSFLSSPVIQGNTISASGTATATAFSGGGAICCYGGEVTIESNEITGCLAQCGGGIYLYQSNATISNNVITGSSPNADFEFNKDGGGVHALQSMVVLNGNVITDNDGYNNGGGVYLKLCTGGIMGDTISYNDCLISGGGIHADHSALAVSGAVIIGNTYCGTGGGINHLAESLFVENSIIALNGSGSLGGGIFADSTWGGIVNNTVDRNDASSGGGNIFLGSTGSLDLKNNLISYGAVDGINVSSPDSVCFRYNNCYGNTSGDVVGMIPDSTNISRNPLYADTVVMDYHLLVHSGGIDTGDPIGGVDPDSSRADQGAFGGPGALMAAPEFVKNLTAEAVSDTTIRLMWDQLPSPDVDYYAIYGDTIGGFMPDEASCLGTVPTPCDTFLHSPVGGCWYYRISAVNISGYGGGYSNQGTACVAGADLTPPSVTVIQPNGGEIYETGDTLDIRWIATDNRSVDSVSIYCSYNGSVDFSLITHGESNDSLYRWIAPSISSDSCLIKVVAYDPGLLIGEDTSDNLFTITDHPSDIDGDTPVLANRLEQNYPNPFNPTTRIKFTLKETGSVSLRIYDTAGRFIRALVDGQREAGRHEEIWDGKDRRGRPVASGIYFYRLVAGEFTETRKMVLLR